MASCCAQKHTNTRYTVHGTQFTHENKNKTFLSIFDEKLTQKKQKDFHRYEGGEKEIGKKYINSSCDLIASPFH